MSAVINVRGAIGIRVRTAEEDLKKVDVEAVNDLANRTLEMLRLLGLALPEAELRELVRYTVRHAPEHYFSDPEAIRWFESTLQNVRYWHALKEAGAARRLRLVGGVDAAQDVDELEGELKALERAEGTDR